MNNSSTRGFSLIELMVVIAIVAILAAIAMPAYKNYAIKSKIAALQPIMNSYVVAVQQYYGKTGRWPSSTDLKLDPIPWTTYSPYLTNIQGLGIGNGWSGTNCTAPGATSIIVAVFDGQKLAGSSNFFTNAWNWGSTSNSLAWLIWVYAKNNGNVITSVCGTIGNTNANDYKFLPANCQQDLSSFTPDCT